MSGFGRNATETADVQKKSTVGSTTSTRRQFGRDITNSTSMMPDGTKDSLKPTMPPAPAVSTARVDTTQAPAFTGSNVERPYMDRPSDDIDARDVDNPLLCTEYVNQMYDNFSVMERDIALNANYMSKQSFINEKMRAILCDWLVRVSFPVIMVYIIVIAASSLILQPCFSWYDTCP